MQKWEYRTVTRTKSDIELQMSTERRYWLEELERESGDGWEVVGLAVVEEIVLVLLKRPVID